MDSKELIRKMIDTVAGNPGKPAKTLNETQISINLDGEDADEFLSRLMQLSGQEAALPVPVDPAPMHDIGDQPPAVDFDMPVAADSIEMPPIDDQSSKYVCDACGMTEHDCGCGTCDSCGMPKSACECDMSVSAAGPLISSMEENADYDYGHDDNSGNGELVDQKTYIYRTATPTQQITKGNMGDNPMVAEEAMARYKKMVNEYVAYMSESSIPNEDGVESPLTASDRQEFDKDPFAGDEPDTDGSMSPMSMIKRQDVMK